MKKFLKVFLILVVGFSFVIFCEKNEKKELKKITIELDWVKNTKKRGI